MGLDRIEQKLDKVAETQTEIKIDLAEHIRRTDLLEDKSEKTDNKLQKIIYLLIAGAGAAAVEYGTGVLKFLGFLL